MLTPTSSCQVKQLSITAPTTVRQLNSSSEIKARLKSVGILELTSVRSGFNPEEPSKKQKSHCLGCPSLADKYEHEVSTGKTGQQKQGGEKGFIIPPDPDGISRQALISNRSSCVCVWRGGCMCVCAFA